MCAVHSGPEIPCRYPCATSACAERCALPLAHQSARQQRSPPHTAAGPPPPTAAQPSGAAASPAAEKAVRAGSAPGCGFKLGTMRRSSALWYLRGALAGWWGGEARLRRGEERRAHVRLVRLACRKVQRGFREVQRGPREGSERVQRGFREGSERVQKVREGSERGPKKGRLCPAHATRLQRGRRRRSTGRGQRLAGSGESASSACSRGASLLPRTPTRRRSTCTCGRPTRVLTLAPPTLAPPDLPFRATLGSDNRRQSRSISVNLSQSESI